MEMINRPRCISDGESDLEPEDVCPIDQKDSGHGSFSTLPRNTPERNHIVRNVSYLIGKKLYRIHYVRGRGCSALFTLLISTDNHLLEW